MIYKDAQAGDVFVVNMQAKEQADRAMTIFARFVITVGITEMGASEEQPDPSAQAGEGCRGAAGKGTK